MSAPTQDVTWDSNATHSTPTVSSHKTDGWASNEVPPSDELNYWMMAVALWIQYLGGLRTRTDNISALDGIGWQTSGGAPTASLATVFGPGYDADGARVEVPAPGGIDVAAWILTVRPPVGRKVTAIRARVKDVSTHACTLSFQKTTTAGDTNVGNQNTDATGNKQTVSITGLAEVIAADAFYTVMFSAGTSGGKIWGVEVDSTDP
jgi:hypothetical protein